MDEWTDRESDLLDRLARKAEQDPQFSDEDLKILRQLITAFRGWQSFGRGAKVIVVSLGLVAGGLAAYDVLLDRIRSWLIGG